MAETTPALEIRKSRLVVFMEKLLVMRILAA